MTAQPFAAAEASLQPTVISPMDADDRDWVAFRGLPNVWIKEFWRTSAGVAGLVRFAAGAAEVMHEHQLGHHHMWLVEGGATIGEWTLESGAYVHVPAGVRHALTAGPAGATFQFVYIRLG